MPTSAIAAILAVTAVVGFGSGSGSTKQSRQNVAALLKGIPQNGTELGHPDAPLTLWVYADLECPTVRSFVASHLPSILETWVRPGAVKLEYRSLQTDTLSEAAFFRQEAAALAAGRQDRLWNFALTFVSGQGDAATQYATGGFLRDIAAQIPDLNQDKWDHDRTDPLLSKRVALSLYSAQVQALSSTPSLLIGFTDGNARKSDVHGDPVQLKAKVAESLRKTVAQLRDRSSQDVPILKEVRS